MLCVQIDIVFRVYHAMYGGILYLTLDLLQVMSLCLATHYNNYCYVWLSQELLQDPR